MTLIDVDALTTPPTSTASAALSVVRAYSSPALVNHCLRSWIWAVSLAESQGISFDRELLYVATMLHDLGVTPHFDAHEVAFEEAGGAVGRVFAAGAGWSEHRQRRVAEIIERHMLASVDKDVDPEGHLLEAATSFDVCGVAPELWPDTQLRKAVTQAIPRLDFDQTFVHSIHEQAVRKPSSQAARLDRSGRVLAGGEAWVKFIEGV
ncbi:hypothetical protein PENSPDRAFT_438612 [Peniophora sp. CONT]|nr:hypothetical protein PENSPDRAFT_438612 [Peniophora sp. CONT]